MFWCIDGQALSYETVQKETQCQTQQAGQKFTNSSVQLIYDHVMKTTGIQRNRT